MERLPTASPFLPATLKWRIADSATDGVDGFGIPPTTVTTDGGGYWVAEFGNMRGVTDVHHRAMRGVAARTRGGARVSVPFLERFPTGGLETTGFSDGTLFTDGAGFVSGVMIARLEVSVQPFDDTALIRVLTDHPLKGDDVFSLLRSDELGDEMHQCLTWSEVSPRLWSVTVAPQFRQAFPAGTAVDFNAPRCAMKVQDPEGGLWPGFDRTWISRTSARFVEAVR